MRVGVPSQAPAGETRVALTPDVAGRLAARKLDVVVEAGAGERSHLSDAAFEKAGARAGSADEAWGSEIVAVVRAPSAEEIGRLSRGAVLIGFLNPLADAETARALASAGVTSFAMEAIPRITRAQSMDALSSQATVAGYLAVLLAAENLDRFFPMLTTAAGTIKPATVLVLGAGVAGLQAIATARRLGAVVEAYDVRPAVKEEVQSLGARFLELELDAQEGEGGYARAQSEEFLQKQRELLAERVGASDVVVTTAAIPGRRAPVLVTGAMVRGMRPGSVIVDLASETGGNCELTELDRVVEVDGVFVDGTGNVPSTIPLHASQLYARNVANLFLHLLRDGKLEVDFEDEITRGCCVTHGGEIVHQRARELMEAAS